MDEFVLLFRRDLKTPAAQPTPAQMTGFMSQWMAWIDDIDQRGRLAPGGNHLLDAGRLVRSGGQVVDDSYEAHHESVTGYVLILAADLDDATRIALKCPLLNGPGNSVEIRQTASP
jgi:hypothetical protein